MEIAMGRLAVAIIMLCLFAALSGVLSGCDSKPFPYYIPSHGNMR